MRGFLDSRGLLSFFLGVAVAAACVVLLQPSALCPFHGLTPADRQELAILMSNRTHDGPCSKKLLMPATSPDDVRLLSLLRRASMDDDATIILTFTNKAWAAPGSLMDLFLESFRLGVRTAPLLARLVIVAVDAAAYERCTRAHPLCYRLPVRGGANSYASEQKFMRGDYLDLMWRRNRFQARVLRLGYSFVFTDMDILWLRNPLLRVPVAADLAMSADYFHGDNPYDLNKTANGGFVYARAGGGGRTAAFYDGWYAARAAFPGRNEQDVFDRVKHALAARHGVRVQFLDTAYLTGFCQLSKDFRRVCTVHGNCIFGLRAKLRKLGQVMDEWKKFRADAARLGSNTTVLTD